MTAAVSRSDRLGDELMLCNVSVANLPLQQVIPAAAEAGFDSVSVVARAHRRAVERDNPAEESAGPPFHQGSSWIAGW